MARAPSPAREARALPGFARHAEQKLLNPSRAVRASHWKL